LKLSTGPRRRNAETVLVSRPARWLGRILSGIVILFMLFDGAIKLVPWPIVTDTMGPDGL